jgi:type IV pilus assembly protein PilB
MAKSQKKLGEILIEMTVLRSAEVEKGLAHAKSKGLRLGEALVDLKLATEPQVYKALAQQQNMEYFDLDKSSIPPNAVNLIPDDLMRKYIIIPLGKESGKLRLAIHDPLDFEMLEILRFRLNLEPRPVLAPKSRIKQLLDEMFNTTSSINRSTSPGWVKTSPTMLPRLRSSSW